MDDILFARTGATVGKSYLVEHVESPAVFASYLIRVRCRHESLLPGFAAWYFQSPGYWEQILEGAEGTGQPNFNGTKLGNLAAPIPPLPEQRRIVAKLDALTARLARARAELNTAARLSKELRRQGLISCFGQAGSKFTELGSILGAIEAGKNMRCEERPPRRGELGVVKVSAVTWGLFNAKEAKTLPADYLPPAKARIRKGDLLISRANTIELVGAVVLVDHEPDGLFLSDKILRLMIEDGSKRWVLWFLRSELGRKQIESLATGNQLSMRNISQDALRRIKLPFPNTEARTALLTELEATVARADSLEAEATRARNLLDRLQSAILARAFAGKLVPQDPNDEPASVLLDRIRAQRAAAPKPSRRRSATAP